MKKQKLFLLTCAAFLYGSSAYAQTDSTQTETEVVVEDDFFDMELEDFLNMEVTSVSKKAERLQDVASSIYVVTADDIKNSGATNLHEVLRTVPGYWGVQDEYSSVAPAIRNSPVANGSTGTVLYLLDGTPIQDLMGSTFSFKNFDIPLDEIDRIEVIRGSGGVIYGANSATGVVNIFTKSPEKYDGINVRAEAANPGYANVTVRAGGKLTDKLSLSGYGKMRHFEGFGLMNEFKGTATEVPSNEKTDSLVNIQNRFQKNFEKQDMYSFGLKAAYTLSDKSNLSLNTHYNIQNQTEYTNYDTELALLPEVIPGTQASDVLVENNVTRTRFVGNLRFDHSFNDNHSIFIRTSTNQENDFLKLLGGYQVNNAIYDFEIQDNLSLGKYNDLSFGANYRIVQFDVNNINNQDGVAYVDPENTESLKGFFVQDKVKLLNEKLNVLVGVKGENYSLINDKYYFSPMAKLAVMPHKDITVWGGFTQSYTTPGYNNTNIDLMLLKKLPDAIENQVATQGVYQGVYQNALNQGSTPAQAEQMAQNYVASQQGQQDVSQIKSQLPNNTGVKNGSNTVPTQYQTWEIGLRANLEKMLSFESNFYYSNVNDGIAASPSPIQTNVPSPTDASRTADYFLYGNYIKGTIYGTETVIKIIPSKETNFEISHVYTESSWEYQENDDFDVNTLTEEERDETPETSVMPKHVFRMKGSFKLPKNFGLSISTIYATNFATESYYNYEQQRYPNILNDNLGTLVAENNSRTIINFKIDKYLLDNKLNIYMFGNDIFNEGLIANTSSLSNVTLSQIGSMFGLGANYKF